MTGRSFRPTNPSSLSGALDFVRDIVSDRVVIVSYFMDDRWCGSTATLAELPTPRPESFGNRSYNRIRVRSWSGARNAEVKV